MKKMIFSAIALVAFTATSFAAETKNGVKVEVKTTTLKKQNKKKKIAKMPDFLGLSSQFWGCLGEANKIYKQTIAAGQSESNAQTNCETVMFLCLNYGDE
jgi:hypothetical protein